jgi:hypothetical protein
MGKHNRSIKIAVHEVVIATQCTATFFLRSIVLPNLGITNVNMPIKFCSEAYFFMLEVN